MEKQEVAASSSLKTLHSFNDKERLLSVGGRLLQSSLPYQTMHQMILPSNQHITKFVVSAEHISLHYAGPISLRLGPPRSKTITKGHNAKLVCFLSNAVHIEVVTSLPQKHFLLP